MASIVDKPKESDQSDLLEIEKYTNGLIKFIETSATPITIGVQGEWGSGKTSLLNTIKQDLCDKTGSQHYAVWINTWEYSLLSNPDETLVKIIIGLIEQIGKITKKISEDSFKKVSALGKSLLMRASKAGGTLGMVAGIASDTVNTLSDNNNISDNTIRELRESLQIVIDKAVESSDKESFIFFIDDLDRLDPAVAVNILELIKNLFDLKNCIFVLAIDYGVVVKGLQSKFGKMTEENEWEFRAFFDKIIQLPFSMPISSYNIEKYLQSLLVNVNYFDKADLENNENLEKISEIVNLSVGTNPRTLKRLANSVSLIEIIRGDQVISPEERIIEFALICIQIAYPSIYSLILREPDFSNWGDQVVYSVLKNKKIDTSDLDSLKETDEFDEEWEQNLWKICQISTFLKGRAHSLSRLLNFIKDNIPKIKGEEISATIERLLSMSSVTSVSADSTSTVSKEKYQRVSYDDWDAYKQVLIEKGTDDDSISHLKQLLQEITERYDNDIKVEYNGSKVSLKNLKASTRKKNIMSIYSRKKGFNIEFSDMDIETEQRYPSFQLDKQWLTVTLTKDNGFDFQDTLAVFDEKFHKMI